MKITEKLELGRLTTFLPNKNLPIHNWFYFKEAFSRDLVFLLVKTWRLRGEDLVLDPFVGCGTVPLACKELGIGSVGYDVHPTMLFASRVKLRDYDAGELRKAVQRFLQLKFGKNEAVTPEYVVRFFSKHVLEDIIFFRSRILEIEDEKTRDFLLLGLMNAAMRCSWVHKDGAAIKVVKKQVPPFRKTFERQLLRMCEDVEQFRGRTSRVMVKHGDARNLDLEDETVDAVIASPPYLNKWEYIYAYRVEQQLLGLSSPSPRELIGMREEGTVEDFSEVEEFIGTKSFEARLYFKDLFQVLKELYRVCKPGARVALITSDACSPSGVTEVCAPLSEIAEKVGFKAKRMLVVNRRFCTTPARKKVGVTLEGLLLLEK